jgi:hypothetical protein
MKSKSFVIMPVWGVRLASSRDKKIFLHLKPLSERSFPQCDLLRYCAYYNAYEVQERRQNVTSGSIYTRKMGEKGKHIKQSANGGFSSILLCLERDSSLNDKKCFFTLTSHPAPKSIDFPKFPLPFIVIVSAGVHSKVKSLRLSRFVPSKWFVSHFSNSLQPCVRYMIAFMSSKWNQHNKAIDLSDSLFASLFAPPRCELGVDGGEDTSTP